MPARLLLLRHGKARNDLGLHDFCRPLAARGQEDVVRVARLARQRGLMPTTVLVSASLRTRETAALFCESVRICPVEFVDRDLYLADAAALLGRIRNLPDTGGTVMLVGHNPGLEELAAALTPGHGPGHVGTSHLLAFEYLDIQADAPGHVRLMEVIVPSQA